MTDFLRRHLGPSASDIAEMLATLGLHSLDELVDEALPPAIRHPVHMDLPPALTEPEALARLSELAGENQLWRSYLGMGYYDCHTPSVILRNVLENPGWYTAYTPYQAEVAQGRLEALLIFQQMVQDLTALPIANASLLDEGTAAAEAMALCKRAGRSKSDTFFVSDACHPQTIAVVQGRAQALGWEVVVGDATRFDFSTPLFGALVQYPETDGVIRDFSHVVEALHRQKGLVVVAADLLALTLLRPPGEWGADVAIGTTQRFGVPMGFGGPHAAYMAVGKKHFRKMPGRIIGVSRDATGATAYRMALQTREQHIRREKATSNVCTAQVLLAVVAALYAVWHGPEGLTAIATRIHERATHLARGLRSGGYEVSTEPLFDTVRVEVGDRMQRVLDEAARRRINLRVLSPSTLTLSLDETTTDQDVVALLACFGVTDVPTLLDTAIPAEHARTTPFLQHPVFHEHRSETEMMRYLHRLEARDLALNTAMIPLGSCTMKLNAATEMAPITWEGFGRLHPFAPPEQTRGYQKLIEQLSEWLCAVTGYDALSMQPNSGAQGEYTGLMVIRAYHRSRGDAHRRVCLIPSSAHGTNPASAVMAGMEVVVVACDEQGNIDVSDLEAKAVEHSDRLAALMVTYPSTHGVYEERIREICDIVHAHGGQVYMDGANLNALLGLAQPGKIGSDVSHLNLHKTFAIPHGGGGPGMGPIGVRAHLAPFLPGHPLVKTGGEQRILPVSAGPFGSPSILPISWAYIAMAGAAGLKRSAQVAILNANYVAKRLEGHFEVLYRGERGRVAHECILECRDLKASTGIEAEDIAKRLMDYGFHAPTMSFPVPGTLMVEPTESEPKHELDRFCDAMIAIREEIRAIERGEADPLDNPLKHAPHPALVVTADEWTHPYTREQAAYPTEWSRHFKYWPACARVDNVYGDRHLITELP